MSVPELTPNRSSSSPPPATSELDGDNSAAIDSQIRKTVLGEINISVPIGDIDKELDISADSEGDADDDSLLGPVKFWGESPKAAYNTLQPGIKLGLNSTFEDDGDDEPLVGRARAGKKPDKGKRKVCLRITPMHYFGLTQVTLEENVFSTCAYLSHSQP
jgi:hypothetical protein